MQNVWTGAVAAIAGMVIVAHAAEARQGPQDNGENERTDWFLYCPPNMDSSGDACPFVGLVCRNSGGALCQCIGAFGGGVLVCEGDPPPPPPKPKPKPVPPSEPGRGPTPVRDPTPLPGPGDECEAHDAGDRCSESYDKCGKLCCLGNVWRYDRFCKKPQPRPGAAPEPPRKGKPKPRPGRRGADAGILSDILP